MDIDPKDIVRGENPEEQVDVSRYLRFVAAFLMLIFLSLGIYQYYYGSEAKDLQDSNSEIQVSPVLDQENKVAP